MFRSPVYNIIVAVAVVGIALAMLPNRGFRISPQAQAAEAKQNAHAIAMALERYAVDHGYMYPKTLSQLHVESYLPVLPRNPYLRCADHLREDALVMREIPLGRHAPGCVTYVPYSEVYEGKDGIYRYRLFLYGDEKARRAHLSEPAGLRGKNPELKEVAWDYVLMTCEGGGWRGPICIPNSASGK